MPDKPKRQLSPEHLEKMRLGRERAKARREAEKKKAGNTPPKPSAKDADKYQRELLENYKQNKERERRLKEQFNDIKARTLQKAHTKVSEPEPEPEDLEPETEAEDLEPSPVPSPEPRQEIIKPEPEPEYDEYAEYQNRVARIAKNLKNQEARQMFNQICGVYDRSKSLEDNLASLMDDVDERLKKQANALQAKRDKIEEEQKKQNEIAKQARIEKQKRLRAAMMRLA